VKHTLFFIVLAGCVDPVALKQDHEQLTSLLSQAAQQGARDCVPRETAIAEANESFALLEFEQGDTRRARDHIDIALANARLAVDGSVGCLTTDTDGDGIMDIDDRCVEEPEDIDGDRDDDGCPDIEPDLDEDGITGESDRCPMEPEDFDEFEDEDGCPDLDNDSDGISDSSDECPNEPEDVDGFEDENGCPDPDNDGDGVLDGDDKCPEELETPNNYVDDDGCFDELPKNVRIVQKQIVIEEKIKFQSGRSTILRVSHGILNSVNQVLVDHPYITVRIEGHTDSDGSDEMNQKLSERRAESVRKYLVSQGIEGERLTFVGYGEARPIASNRSAAGKAENRRVEFHITSGMD